jgi:aminoglycoside phosphotransferase family enzyme/predicted kinase
MSAERDATPDSIARALARPSAWPDGAPPPEWIQTHISHVFLVGDRVYKLRKAVSLGFLDFGTRAERNEDCRREVELNRRLAPSVYLGVAPIEVDADDVRVGPVGEKIDDPEAEHVVVMRRLPEGTDALSRLERGDLDADDVEAVADRLARFHASAGLGRPAPWTAEAWRERIAQPVLDCIAPLAESDVLDAARVAALERDVRKTLARLAPRFEARRVEGRAVDGHGDVHLDHVFFEAGSDEPLLIDCLEFSDDLRRIDAASEVAFLAMDLRYRGHPGLAEWFLAAYACQSDDYGLFTVVDFFAAYRALVRAKVAALATGQDSIAADQREAARASAVRHAELAEGLLAPPPTGEVVLLCGTVGSGKSTVARRMARAGDGIPIVSDRVRKAEAGIEPETRAGDGTDEGLYRPERVEAVYEAMLERAGPVVEGGRAAILDAGYGTRARRDRARAWAEARKVPIRLVEVRCSPETARARLEARARAGRDPSDAGPELLATSLERFEPPDEWPPDLHQIVHSHDD